MKLTIEKTEFMDAINRAIKAIPSRPAKPIMECFLLEANGGDIKLTANDFELGIETHMYGMVLENGAIALNAKLLSDIVKKMPDSSIYLETNGQLETSLKCEKCLFHIQGIEASDFSPIKIVEKDLSVTMKQKVLKEMIRKTIFCVAKNESNKIMTTLNLMIDKDQRMRIAALDGHRIAVRYTNVDKPLSVSVNVPWKTMDEVSKILTDKEDDEVTIYLEKNYILYQMEQTIVTSRLVEGEYYKIEQMITGDWNTKISVDREALVSTIDRATLFTKAEDRKPVIFEIREKEVATTINSPFGCMNEELDIEKEGKDMRIAFNPYYLLDCMKLIDDEKITWRMLNPKAPAFIENAEGGYLYLILPVNIK